MNLLTVSGFVLISGFVVILIASLIDTHGIYDKNIDTAGRLEIVDNVGQRWMASNGLFALAGLLTFQPLF